MKAESSNEFTITNYLWGNGKTDQTVEEEILDTTYFKVTLTDITGCKNSDSILIQSKPYPIVTIDAPEYVCFGQSAIISAEGANNYVWGTKESGKIDRSFADTPKNDTTYTVYGTTNGCTTKATETVIVRSLPTGETIRLKDVARVELDSESYTFNSRLNMKPMAAIQINQLATANAVETALSQIIEYNYQAGKKDNGSILLLGR